MSPTAASSLSLRALLKRTAADAGLTARHARGERDDEELGDGLHHDVHRAQRWAVRALGAATAALGKKGSS